MGSIITYFTDNSCKICKKEILYPVFNDSVCIECRYSTISSPDTEEDHWIFSYRPFYWMFS